MRKNIYNDKILMIEIGELTDLNGYKELHFEENKAILKRLRNYHDLLKLQLASNFKFDIEVGLLLDDEINKKIEEVYEKFRGHYKVSLKSIHNAFLYSVVTQTDREICDTLQFMLINRVDLTIEELKNQYGSDILEYILSHQKYDYVSGINPVIESDKKILLLHNEKVVETETQEMMNCTNGEIYSNANDCKQLAKYLKKKMGNRIEFDGVHEVWCGKYFHYHREPHSDLDFTFDDGLPFYYKFCKGAFLRIGVGSSYKHKTSVGEKLAALSNFYEVLREQYGEPTVFYTLKDDDEGMLSLQWSFINKKEDIKEFRNGSYFDDAKINELIVIGEEKNPTNNPQTEKIILENKILGMLMGLPSELVHLSGEDMRDFVKYKTGKEINVSENVMCDGVPAALYDNDMLLEKKNKGEF